MFIHSIGRLLERAGRRLRRFGQRKQVWIDVGAHLGETTFDHANANPNLIVYAFEPNLKLAGQRMGALPNFIVLPFAIAETDGLSEFHLNSYDQANSLLPFNREGLSQWSGPEKLRIEQVITVPTMRLDTFMNQVGISRVDFLKIDGQFVRDLVDDPMDEAAVRCFAEVARILGVKTVAEFVDRPEVLAKLRTMGIDYGQGFLLHRPAPLNELLSSEVAAA